MENKYISIKEACEQFNKSISTIRRIVKEAPKNQLKKEKLKTGHEKVYISSEYLNECFNVINKESNQREFKSVSNDAYLNSLNEQLEFLKKQLEEKDKQIESFLQRQYESNVIIERLQQKEQNLLESLENKKKRRWWQRNK